MRKLVYYSVYDKDYCDLLKISLESLSNNIDNKTDILVICNLDDSIYIKNLGINYVRTKAQLIDIRYFYIMMLEFMIYFSI